MPVLTRRRFLTFSLGAGVPLGLSIAGLARLVGRHSLLDSEGSPGAVLEPVTRSALALGTTVSITALHADPATAEQAILAAFAELDLVEEVMSLYRPQSALCRLNRDGLLDNPHPYLVEVLSEAARMSERSTGAFDITVQPLWALYAAAAKSGSLPAPAEIAAASRFVDWRHVTTTSARIALRGRGTAITLNGIAQGFAADRVRDTLRRHGIEHALVNTGEIGALGSKAHGEPWTVGIQHPRRDDAWISMARLDGRFLATSGDYATSFSPDRSYNHIFDPRTGRSPEVFSSVSVVAPTGLLADALSTAVSVAGLERGLELVRSTPGADLLCVLKSGRVLRTEGFPEGAGFDDGVDQS